jgi:hypothetical protein
VTPLCSNEIVAERKIEDHGHLFATPGDQPHLVRGGNMSGASSMRGKSPFARLLDELGVADVRRRQRLAANAAPSAFGVAMAKALKEIAALTPAAPRQRRRRSTFFVSPPRPMAGAVLAKAIDALGSDSLSPADRGRLMIGIGAVSPQEIRQAKRAALAQLKAVERQLAAGATEDHLRAATGFAKEAQALMATGRTSDADHAALSLALTMLRERIEGGFHGGK